MDKTLNGPEEIKRIIKNGGKIKNQKYFNIIVVEENDNFEINRIVVIDI